MKILNKHMRILNKPKCDVECLINGLSSNNDVLWPHETWSPMILDHGLIEGATGGHGPIKYDVSEFRPGDVVRFRFKKPAIFRGYHWFELKAVEKSITEISHTLQMNIPVYAAVYWLIIIRPMHDALIEDAFDKAQRHLGLKFKPQNRSGWVRFLRWMLIR